MSWLLRGSLFALIVLFASAPAQADTQSVYQFDTQAEEQRFQSLIEVLRCPKCQNQNIADSNAPISKDMRAAVYRMMNEGKSDEDITNALVARFGEFVRYTPKVDKRTFLLWATPALVVLIGIIIVLLTVGRSRQRASESVDLTEEERSRAARLLRDNDNDRTS